MSHRPFRMLGRASWAALLALALAGARSASGAPAGVVLVSFDATVGRDMAVALDWETASEAGVLGFHVHRSRDPDTAFARITPELVPARGGSIRGETYHLEDRPGAGVFYYRLEVVDSAGHGEWYGQVRVEVAAPRWDVFLPLLVRS